MMQIIFKQSCSVGALDSNLNEFVMDIDRGDIFKVSSVTLLLEEKGVTYYDVAISGQKELNPCLICSLDGDFFHIYNYDQLTK